jgi:hypothetical protein
LSSNGRIGAIVARSAGVMPCTFAWSSRWRYKPAPSDINKAQAKNLAGCFNLSVDLFI